ncbi:MAG: family 1 encapsulin nanocompartment shell protein [Bacteroidales bacterium]
MSNYHEPVNELTSETRDFVRALNSLKEEIEAVDWYQQRMDTSSDKQLKKILVSERGGDFELSIGQDISIGYDGHDSDKVKLYFTESFMFRIIGPEAFTVLKPQV